ncbi:MAG: lipid-A-disaccharide synthase [Kiritimatiellae bacterium]|nr:lipid-A-disaccharide synthase [Kiritimatiellia bacterium]
MHAGQVIAALKEKDPSLQVWGIGGERLRAAGVEILHDVREMAVMGLAEVLRKYGFFRKVFDEMVAAARERKPDAVLLVDYPGFNLRFAAEMHRLGIKVLYYVCPQVWAWHRSRIQKMAKIVDRLLVIFPFEVDVFAGTGLKVDFVGHPLVDEARIAKAAPATALPWTGEPRVALLPGSRRQEVSHILPAMWSAAARIQAEIPAASFLVAAPSDEIAGLARQIIAAEPEGPGGADVVVGETREVLRQARAAMVASGTATIEAALMGCPMIVVYKAAWLTYLFGRLLVKVPHIGMVNIVAGRELCPEFIQSEATPAALAAGLKPLLADGPEPQNMKAGLADVARALGEGSAGERAADIVLSELL